MAAFDFVMAFVALLSFIAGFLSGRLGRENKGFAPRSRQPSGGYMRIGGKDEPGRGNSSSESVSEKKSKFDTLFGYYAGEKHETRQYTTQPHASGEPAKDSLEQNRRQRTIQTRHDPHYIEIRAAENEAPQAKATVEPLKQKREQKEEWTPMGFFED